MNYCYGVFIIGWCYEMEMLDMDDVLDFYDFYYLLNNVILVVVGDVLLCDVFELVNKYYGVILVEENLFECFWLVEFF